MSLDFRKALNMVEKWEIIQVLKNLRSYNTFKMFEMFEIQTRFQSREVKNRVVLSPKLFKSAVEGIFKQ